MVAHSARRLTQFNDSDQMRSIDLALACKALRGIQRGVDREGQSPSAGLLVAVGGTICTILESGEHSMDYHIQSTVIKAHVKGLRMLIINYGGWQSITVNCFTLAWLVIWIDTQLCGILLNGFTRTPTTALEQTYSKEAEDIPSPRTAHGISRPYPEIIHMYNKIYLAAKLRWTLTDSTNRSSPILEPIWLFQPWTTVYQILRRKDVFGISPLVPLFYINIILEKTAQLSSSRKLQLYYMYQRSLADVAIDAFPSHETLVWALMTETRLGCFTDLPALECTIRMIYAASKLKPEDQEKLGDTLCDFLLIFQNEAVIGRQNWWTPQQFSTIVWESESNPSL